MTRSQEVDTVVRNVRVVTPSGVLRGSGVAIHQGRIVAVGEEDRLPPARKTIDGEGN
ncbi:MAG: hypothetical protein HYY21_00500, partial [Candidatus Tectomicrobia bacterium]|nr:hypothetical protein [Candidatus Tectomicrobia bacterium]